MQLLCTNWKGLMSEMLIWTYYVKRHFSHCNIIKNWPPYCGSWTVHNARDIVELFLIPHSFFSVLTTFFHTFSKNVGKKYFVRKVNLNLKVGRTKIPVPSPNLIDINENIQKTNDLRPSVKKHKKAFKSSHYVFVTFCYY